MIVVDVGCHTWSHLQPDGSYIYEDSIHPLVERFHPDTLYGFDPSLNNDEEYELGDTKVILSTKAAWTEDGEIGFKPQRSRSRVGDGGYQVKCFDLAAFLEGLDDEVVLKLDIEGSEYPLLMHLGSREVDRNLSLILVEWHEDARVSMRCPVEEWDMVPA